MVTEWHKSTLTTPAPKILMDDYLARGITGTGIKIGIVDDGISDNHPALDVVGGLACGHHTTYLTEIEHGNHCAGIVGARHLSNGEPHGIAPECDLYSIRMAYRTAEERVQSIIEAIDFAVDEELDILSMSIHLHEYSVNWTPENESTRSHGVPKHMRTKMRNAFIKAHENDVLIVVAAGNNNDGSGKDNIEKLEYLPKMPHAVTVSNFTQYNRRYASSGVGRWVDVAGYGFRVRSTIANGGYGSLSGTSMATPMIAGILALYIQLFRNDGLNNREALNKMFENCQPIEGIPVTHQGRGVPMPPKELYELPVLSGYKAPLRIRYYDRWLAVEPFSQINTNWIELEAIGYE